MAAFLFIYFNFYERNLQASFLVGNYKICKFGTSKFC